MAILTPKAFPLSFTAFKRKITFGKGGMPNPALGLMGMVGTITSSGGLIESGLLKVRNMYSWFGRRSLKGKFAVTSGAVITAEALTGAEITEPIIDKGVGGVAWGMSKLGAEIGETAGEVTSAVGEQIITPSVDAVKDFIATTTETTFSLVKDPLTNLKDKSPDGGATPPSGGGPGFGAILGVGLAAAAVVVGLGVALSMRKR